MHAAFAPPRAAAQVRARAAWLPLALALAVGAGVGLETRVGGALVLLAAFAVAAVAAPGLATIVVVFAVWTNLPGVAVRDYGAPAILGAAVPLLLALPLLAALRRGQRLVATRAFVALLVLLVAALLSTLLSDHQDVALAKLRTFVLEGLLLYLLVANVIHSPAQLRRVLWTVLAAGAALAAITVVQELTFAYYDRFWGFAMPDPSFEIGRSPQPRASGPVGDPNYFGQILLVATCAGLVFASRARTPLARLLALGATGLLTFAILLTYSRGTMVGLAVVLLLLAWLRHFRAWQVVALLAGVAVAVAAVPAFTERFTDLSGVSSVTQPSGFDPNGDESARRRSTEVLAALGVFADHPVTGVGPANFPLYYREYAEDLGGTLHASVPGGPNKGDEAERQAHNIFAGQLAELGLLGFIPFAAALGLTAGALVRRRRENLAAGLTERADLAVILLLALAAYVTCGMFLTLAYERYFWLLLGLCGAAAGALKVTELTAATGGGGPWPEAGGARPGGGPGRAAGRRARG